jgi:phosphate transport system substrate-binding protein
MNKFALITVLVLSALFICTGCANEEEESTISPYIEGLSIENYPIIDGSTSTLPLNTVIACELMGLNYQWQENIDGTSNSWSIEPQIRSTLRKKFDQVVKCSQTHNSFINLIDREADLVLNARTMSPDEKNYAQEKGVT